jgi:hypothetical protein
MARRTLIGGRPARSRRCPGGSSPAGSQSGPTRVWPVCPKRIAVTASVATMGPGDDQPRAAQESAGRGKAAGGQVRFVDLPSEEESEVDPGDGRSGPAVDGLTGQQHHHHRSKCAGDRAAAAVARATNALIWGGGVKSSEAGAGMSMSMLLDQLDELPHPDRARWCHTFEAESCRDDSVHWMTAGR